MAETPTIGPFSAMRGDAASSVRMRAGERVVDAKPDVRLVDGSEPCNSVWIGAPTDKHARGVNQGPVLIGPRGGQVMTLMPDDHKGVRLLVSHANRLFLRAFHKGDSVAFIVFG